MPTPAGIPAAPKAGPYNVGDMVNGKPVIVANRAPTSLDVRNVKIGQVWVWPATNQAWTLTSVDAGVATWTIQGGVGSIPITQYVVSADGTADYTTIQAALNAANAAGGGIVYVRPGTYTENLTLYGNTQVVGTPGNSDSGTAGNSVIISGVHVPPASGSFVFANIRLNSATHIFSSAAAGTAALVLINVFTALTNGFIFNLTNWTGDLVTYNVGDGSTNNGVVTNTGGATCFFVSATHGAGTGQTMLTSGLVDMQEIDLGCPWNAATGTVVACDYVIFSETVTLSNNSTGAFNSCRWTTGATIPITMSSSAAVAIANSVIDSSANPVIAGSGSGTLQLTGISLLDGTNISGTLTTSNGSFLPSGGSVPDPLTLVNDITTTTGDFIATLGSVSAGATVTAGTGITATTGDVTISSGNCVITGYVQPSGGVYFYTVQAPFSAPQALAKFSQGNAGTVAVSDAGAGSASNLWSDATVSVINGTATATFTVSIDTYTAGSGNVQINVDILPTCTAGSSGAIYRGSLYVEGITFTGASLFCELADGANTILLGAVAATGVATYIQSTDMPGTGGFISGQIIFPVA